jgi:hypothetical protein
VNTPVWEFKAPNVSADTLLRFQLNVTDNLGQVGIANVNVLDKPASQSIAQPSNQIIKSPFTAVHLLPKLKTGNNNNNVTNRIASSSLPLAKTSLHMVKITSPTKGQQIPVHGNLVVSGTSVANSTSGYCDVSVIVNGIKPYQKTVATGKGGTNDYSTWNYRLTPANAIAKEGQNKITAKFSCTNNPSLTSYNSVNVIGVANNNQAIATSPQPVSIPNSNSKPLLISLDLAKNSINAGDEETIKIRVLNPSNPNMTIAGASIIGIVTDSTNTTTINFNGITDNSGIFTYTWNVSKNSKPGIFTVSVLASATGYKSRLIPTTTTFNVKPVFVQEMIPPRKTYNCRVFILPPGPCA